MRNAVSWIWRRPYLFLLSALFALLLGYPLVHDKLVGQVVFDLLFTLIFIAAFQIVFKRVAFRRLALVLGIPTLISAWSGYFLPGPPRLPILIVAHLIAAVFLAFTTATILHHIYREEILSLDSIFGAFCGYLLVALAFSHLYCIVESLVPGAFSGLTEGEFPGEGRHRFSLVYFSLITLTTVGYGDIRPVSASARGLAVIEAVFGQFYIAVLVAELIGKRVSQAGPRHRPKLN